MKNFTLLFVLFVSWSSLTFAQDAKYRSKSENLSREKKSELTKEARTKIKTKSLQKSKTNSVFYAGFENWDSQDPGKLPAGWTQFRTSTLNSNPTQQPDSNEWMLNNPDSDVFGNGVPWNYVYMGEGSMVIGYNAGNGSSLGKFTWAVTPSFMVTGKANDSAYLTYYKWFQHDVTNAHVSAYHVQIFSDGVWKNLASFVGPDAEANIFDDFVALDISDYINKSVKIAFVYEYTDGYQMAIDEIDVMVLHDYDNGIDYVAYDFGWWPHSVNKTMGLYINVNGWGQIPIDGKVSLYVNDQLQDTAELDALSFGMSTDTILKWTPTTHGNFTIRIQLSNQVSADGAIVYDENPGNNVIEFEISIRDPQTVFLAEGFEHVDWDNPDGPVAIFPPSENWSLTDKWVAEVDFPESGLISATSYQSLGEAPEYLITPSLNLAAGKFILEMLVGVYYDGVTSTNGVYLGHSTLKVYLTTKKTLNVTQDDILLLTYSFENGNTSRQLSLNFETTSANVYYLKFETTTTYSNQYFKSWVLIDNIYLYQPAAVSVQEPSFTQKLVLYPNPVRQTLNLDNNKIINHVRIFDITGRVVYSNAANGLNHQINVSQFTEGVYVIHVISGDAVHSKKFNVVK
jgi:hypothetical protein